MKIVKVAFLYLIVVNAIAMEDSKKTDAPLLKKSFQFALPLDEISSPGMKLQSPEGPGSSKMEKWQQLTFLGSASQRSVRQQFIEGLLTVGTPKKDQDPLAYRNQVLRYREFIKYLQRPNFGHTLEKEEASIKILHGFSLEGEHKRVKTTFALLEEFLALLLYHAQGNDQNLEKAKKYSEKINNDKICYYKKYFYLIAKKYEKTGIQLLNQAKLETNELYKNLYYYTSITCYNNAKYFYRQSYALKSYKPHEKEDKKMLKSIHAESSRFLNQDVLIILKKIDDKIKKMPLYTHFLGKLNEVRSLKKEAEELLRKVSKLRKECNALEEKTVVFPKAKKEKQELKKIIFQIIDKEVTKLDNSLNKDTHKQAVEELVTMLRKKEYQKLVLRVREFDVSEKKATILDDLTVIEIKFINLASLYLHVFRFSPQKKYVRAAEKVMATLSTIGKYKIECNPHSIIIPDDIRILWDEIKKAYDLVDHRDNKKLFRKLKEVELLKQEAHQWMI